MEKKGSFWNIPMASRCSPSWRERMEMKHSNLYHRLKIEWLRHHVQPGLKVAIPAGVDTQRRLHGAEKGRDRGFWRERASGMDFLTPFYIVETCQLMPHEAGGISWACLPTSFTISSTLLLSIVQRSFPELGWWPFSMVSNPLSGGSGWEITGASLCFPLLPFSQVSWSQWACSHI